MSLKIFNLTFCIFLSASFRYVPKSIVFEETSFSTFLKFDNKTLYLSSASLTPFLTVFNALSFIFSPNFSIFLETIPETSLILEI